MLLKAGLVTVICSLFSTPALSDTFAPFIKAGVDHEDNLFRLPDAELQQIDNGADTYRTVGGGVRFERPVSRQVLSGVADVSSVKFDRNQQLDYTRKDLSADWHWFVGKRFEGHVGTRYLQELASFADFESVQRNLRVNRRHYADGSWRFHPSWRLRSEYTKDEFVYELFSQRANDRTEESLIAGADYLARSGSTVGLQLRRLEGTYPNWLTSGSNGFLASMVNGYVQQEAKLNVLWLATGSTQVMFLGGWVQRKQNAETEGADSGTNARLIVNWSPAGRMKLVAQAWREFSAIEGTLIDSALTNGASAVMTWEFSAKIQAVVDVKHEKRDFTPYGGITELPVSDISSDSRDTTSVGLVYKPLRNITVKANAFRDRRSGSIVAGTNSYKANGASFSASLQFH